MIVHVHVCIQCIIITQNNSNIQLQIMSFDLKCY